MERDHHVGVTVLNDEKSSQAVERPVIPGFAVDRALVNFDGDIGTYLGILGIFVKDMPKECAKLDTYLRQSDFENYRITVHGIKGSCLIVGAEHAAAKALDLERAARDRDSGLVADGHDGLLLELGALVDDARRACDGTSSSAEETTSPAPMKKVFLVDDSMTSLQTGKDLLKGYYKTYALESAEMMFDMLEDVRPDIILLDVDMPEMNGYTAIRMLKNDERYASIPVIFLTGRSDDGDEQQGLELGAVDYVAKPFKPSLLLARIDSQMRLAEQRQRIEEANALLNTRVEERTAEISRLQRAMLEVVADLVEFRDDITGGHITRTQGYLELLIDEAARSEAFADEVAGWNRDAIIMASPLHDVGKIAISDAILNKPGKLNAEEFEAVKEHTTKGVNIIKRIAEDAGNSDMIRYAIVIAGTHHEKWDGSGYPIGLAGKSIPLEGRMMAIADVYDALVSSRPYKAPMSPQDARDIIIAGSGTHFDPDMVKAFERVADRFAIIAKKALYD